MIKDQNQLRLFVDRVIHSRYKIISEIGKGGMGAVFEALDLTCDRRVAIKQTLPSDPNLMAAAKREAFLLADLDYPQLPHLLDRFEEETGFFLVMQFVAGPTLGQLLNARQLPFAPNQVRLWAKDILHTLAYLHGHSPAVVHHDIKPANLKLLPDGSVALLDFGLAQLVSESETDELADTLLAYTPNYAPPEQIMGQRTGEYSDIYALGATLYHLLTGRVPADSLKRSRQMRSSKIDPLEPIHKIIRGVPQALAQSITNALSLDPQERPTSAAEMIEQLSANTPVFNAIRAVEDEQTVATPKPAVLSGHRDRITVEIEPASTRHSEVVSLLAYREEKQRAAARRRFTARTLVNIASVITILFTVASVSVYLRRNVYDDPRQTSWQEDIVAEEPQAKTRPRVDPYAFVDSITLDQLARRWHLQTVKRDRSAARRHAHSLESSSSAIPALPAATITF